ncbi:zinc-binding dehydrogenase [bacterium]|nr:zinc-binding dehydrogenase [bacterium]
MVINKFGNSGVFELVEMERPQPKPHEVLIKVEASSVNPVDYKIRDGRGAFLCPTFPAILHPDCAGTIVEIGDDATNFEIGDRVYAFASGIAGKPGALAEYMVADARMIAKIPNNLSFIEAAALPLVSVTSWYAMIDVAQVQRSVSISCRWDGGVGHIALQLAKIQGAVVAVTVSSSQKAEIAKNLGADIIINYNEIPLSQWMETAPDEAGYDVVFNTPGAPSINGAVAAAKFGGTIVDILGDFPTKPGFQGKWLTFKSLFAGHEIVAGTNPSYVGKILTEIAKVIEVGQLKPVIDQNRFKFSEVGLAHDYAETKSPTGKVVLVQDLSVSSKFSEGI